MAVRVHFTGRVRRHQDAAWILDAVTRLTAQNEAHREPRWSPDDAPATYVEKQLRAIVGIELVIEKVEAKAKLSQNRDDADFSGVVTGLRSEGSAREAAAAFDGTWASPWARTAGSSARPRSRASRVFKGGVLRSARWGRA